jgi:Holliday junction resolvase RusA-like endonuclease
MRVLKVVYPELPPTSNKIYFNGTILRREAREWAERFAHFFAKNYLHITSDMDAGALYAVHLHFYFKTVINESYNNASFAPSRRAKTRYKKFDLTNRVKLLEDCIRDAIGIDDSQTFVASQEKHMDSRDPRVEIFIHEVEPMQFGIPPEALMR